MKSFFERRSKRVGLIGIFLFFTMGIVLAEEPVSFEICDQSFNQSFPAVDGGYIVWEDYINGNADIYGKNFSTGEQAVICQADGDQKNPVISGDIIVWEDERGDDSDIYGYDLSEMAEFEIFVGPGQQTNPSVSGDYVVWRSEPNEGGDGDIYGYDMVSDSNFVIVEDSYQQYLPVVDSNIVVWVDNRYGNFDILGYDIDTGLDLTICTEGSEQYNPDIDDGYVVWEDGRDPVNSKDIYGREAYGSGNGEAVCSDPEKQTQPCIDGDVVLWTDKRNYSTSHNDIYYCLVDEKVARPVCTESAQQDWAAYSNGLAVWHDERNGFYSDIYGALLPLAGEITLSEPNGGEEYAAGTVVPIRWASTISPAGWVEVEVSTDGGDSFDLVAERVANTGEFDWQTEDWRNSQDCVVRVSDLAYGPAADESDGMFRIYQCDPNLTGDVTGDCVVDMADFAIISGQWMQTGKPGE